MTTRPRARLRPVAAARSPLLAAVLATAADLERMGVISRRRLRELKRLSLLDRKGLDAVL